MKKKESLPDGAKACSFKKGSFIIEERKDLQPLMTKYFDEIFKTLQKDFIFLDSEKSMGDTRKRFDILGMDSTGRLIVLELKRGEKAVILTQAMGYCGILSTFGSGEKALEKSGLSKDKKNEIQKFLKTHGTPISQFNHRQCVLLVAEGFEIKVRGSLVWINSLVGALDLTSEYITGMNVTLHQHQDSYYLTFEYDDLDLDEVQGTMVGGQDADETIPTRNEAIAAVQNSDAQDFLTKHIDGEWYKDHKHIYYRINGARTWRARICKKHVRIRQYSTRRFKGDIAYWSAKLPNESINQTKKGLTFKLKTAEEFKAFEAGMLETHNWIDEQ